MGLGMECGSMRSVRRLYWVVIGFFFSFFQVVGWLQVQLVASHGYGGKILQPISITTPPNYS
jgi:hypothetical protein